MDEDCPLCEELMESTKHLLCDFTYTKAVWDFATLDQLRNDREGESFSELFSSLARQQPKAVMELFLTICWFIWSGQNAVVWRGERFDASKVAVKSFQYLEELEKLREVSSCRNQI